MNYKKLTIRTTGVIAVIVSLWYIIRSFISSGSISHIEFSWKIIFITAALSILYSAGNVLRALNWGIIIHTLSAVKIPFKPLISIYLKTEIIKYIPSNVMHFAGRHILAREYGASHKTALAANVLDMGFILSAAAAVSFPVLFFSKDILPSGFFSVLYSRKLILIILAVSVLLSAVCILFVKRKKIAGFFSHASIRNYAVIFIIDVFVFILNGALFWFLLRNMSAPETVSIIIAAPLYALCWMAGFIIPGSPGGLGVREALIVFVFGRLCGDQEAIFAAVLMRIISIAGDSLSLAAGIRLTSK